jgi:hypothetical protein
MLSYSVFTIFGEILWWKLLLFSAPPFEHYVVRLEDLFELSNNFDALPIEGSEWCHFYSWSDPGNLRNCEVRNCERREMTIQSPYSILLEPLQFLLKNTSTPLIQGPLQEKNRACAQQLTQKSTLHRHSTPYLPHARNGMKNKKDMNKTWAVAWIEQREMNAKASSADIRITVDRGTSAFRHLHKTLLFVVLKNRSSFTELTALLSRAV